MNLVEELRELVRASSPDEEPQVFDEYADTEDEKVTWSDRGEALVIWQRMNTFRIKENLVW